MRHCSSIGSLLLLLAVTAWSVPASYGQTTDQNSLTNQTYQPLTGSERWHRYLDETYASPLQYASIGAAAAVGLATSSPPEWGHGYRGYGRRLASQFGVFTLNNTIQEGTAAALHYDPRYNLCGCASVKRRIGHAILWSFVTRDDAGHMRPDIPSLAAAYGSNMIAVYWYPSRYNPLTDGVRWGTQQVGITAGMNIVREFTPDIKRVLHWKH